MAKYIFKRILTAIPLIIVITILCFSLIHLAPYDAIDAMTTPKMSPEMVQMIREKYGYDQPVYRGDLNKKISLKLMTYPEPLTAAGFETFKKQVFSQIYKIIKK